MKTRIYGLVIFLCVGSISASAQRLQEIKGHVRDEVTSMSLSNVTVYIANTDLRTQTNAQGYYSIIFEKPVKKDDKVTCVFELDGYKAKRSVLKSGNDKVKSLNIVLRPNNINTILPGRIQFYNLQPGDAIGNAKVYIEEHPDFAVNTNREIFTLYLPPDFDGNKPFTLVIEHPQCRTFRKKFENNHNFGVTPFILKSNQFRIRIAKSEQVDEELKVLLLSSKGDSKTALLEGNRLNSSEYLSVIDIPREVQDSDPISLVFKKPGFQDFKLDYPSLDELILYAQGHKYNPRFTAIYSDEEPGDDTLNNSSSVTPDVLEDDRTNSQEETPSNNSIDNTPKPPESNPTVLPDLSQYTSIEIIKKIDSLEQINVQFQENIIILEKKIQSLTQKASDQQLSESEKEELRRLKLEKESLQNQIINTNIQIDNLKKIQLLKKTKNDINELSKIKNSYIYFIISSTSFLILVILGLLFFIYRINYQKNKFRTVNLTLQETEKDLINKIEEIETQKTEITNHRTQLEATQVELQKKIKEIEEKSQEISKNKTELEITQEELKTRIEEIEIQKEILVLGRHELIEKTFELEATAEELRQQTEVVNQQKEKLEINNDKLKKLQTSKDLLISAVNHDLRNPLNPIINYSSPTYPNPDKEKRLHWIHERSLRMKAMVEEIMYIYQAENIEIHPESQELFPVVEAALKLVRDYQDNMPKLINKIPKTLRAKFHNEYIRRVLENMLINAIKYTNGIPKPKVWIEALENPENETVEIRIRDNGWGISPEKLVEIQNDAQKNKIKTTSGEKSFGIGLRFCKIVLALHNTALIPHSEGEKKGSCFSFVLPLIHEKIKIIEPPISDLNPEDIASEIAHFCPSQQDIVQLCVYAERMQSYRIYDHKMTQCLKEISNTHPEQTTFIQLAKACIRNNQESHLRTLLTKIYQV
ncbi:MAG: ATP-binding protein [Microscillaceae bacterium]|nr:ATP-binding protein [Microscillaceae bacterium]